MRFPHFALQELHEAMAYFQAAMCLLATFTGVMTCLSRHSGPLGLSPSPVHLSCLPSEPKTYQLCVTSEAFPKHTD